MSDARIDFPDFQSPPAEAVKPEPRPSAAGANVIVLSADPVLIELLRDSVAGNHRVWRADDATDAADLLVTAGNAVLLLDSALADQDTRELVTRLHQQFPELSIIVAGRRGDETGLADLISQGTIFRFLHKPVSAERIRNFVDATQRRGQPGADLPAAAPREIAAPAIALAKRMLPRRKLDRAALRRWSRRSLLLIPLAAIVLLVAAWKPWKYLEDLLPPMELPSAPADPGQDPLVLKLLDAAGLALSEGRLIDPPERNALELYRAALAHDPGNQTARQGINRIADEFLAEAEQALTDQDLARLASALDAARSIRPDHPRLRFFTTQLERERDRQERRGRLLPGAGAAVAPEPVTSAAGSTSGRVQGLVLLANQRMRSNQLVGGNDSAHAYLLAAHRLDAADPGVQQGIATLATLLQGNAREAIRNGRFDEADDWLQNAVALDVNRTEVAQLRSDLEVAKLDKRREDRGRLLLLANQRIAQGRLIEPAADSARHYIGLLRASDPAYEGLSDTTALLAARALTEARRLAETGDAAGADALLKAAVDAGAQGSDVTDLAARIAAGSTAKPKAAPVPAVLPENALRRTRFVPPQYPARALQRGIAGWVDVEFSVAPDGTTHDATVRAAEPVGVFERAALDAVARWRYEPFKLDGIAVDQRVTSRVRFELAD